MNNGNKKFTAELAKVAVKYEEHSERLNTVMRKVNKDASMELVLEGPKPPYRATDKWYLVDTETNKKEEVSFSFHPELYDVIEEFMQLEKTYYYPEKHEMTNSRVGENLPYVAKCLYHTMSLKDKRVYDKLPSEVTIYRDANIREHSGHIGQSWTLNKDVAGFFAWVYCTDSLSPENLKDRVILKAKIPKESIFAYSSQRSKDICIVDSLALESMEIYQEYSEENARYAKVHHVKKYKGA